MLDSLCLKGTPAFGAEISVPVKLTPVNFIFGPNGSGKTTISRALADPSRFPGTELVWRTSASSHDIKVYNRDFVAETLRQASNLPGVFLLGKTDAAIQDEIDELTGTSGKIAIEKKNVEKHKKSLAAKRAEIAAAREELKQAAWRSRTTVPLALKEMFVGYGNSREKFLDRLLEVAASNKSTHKDFEDLATEAAAVLDEDAVELNEIPQGPNLDVHNLAGFNLLKTPIVGSRDVHLTPLIEQLQNADWVEHGRHYLNSQTEVCPFCQQKLPADLVEQLDAYFDKRYTQQMEQLNNCRDEAQSWANAWHAHFNHIFGHDGALAHLPAERLKAARAELEQAMTLLLTALDSKLSGPSSVVEIIDPSPQVKVLNEILDTGNASIRLYNSRIRNRGNARRKLIEECWVVFIRKTLAAEVGRYEGAMPTLHRGEEALHEKLKASEAARNRLESRLREIQTEVTSSKPMIDTINRLLESVGFHSFRLIESEFLRDGYSLVRENGEVASDTLSEGEQTFITFLYFAQSLQGAPQTDSELNDLVAVIDDPISSLDSDVLYAVSTLTRRIVADIGAGKGRVQQLVLLTHNAHFHKEVTYKAQGDSDKGWQYGIVRKRSGQPSEIKLSHKNPIQTAYAALWDEVQRSSDDPSVSSTSLQNVLRRILETYFKILGGVDTTAIIEKFSGVDQSICRSLFAWVNAGSHSIFDDIDYSPSAATVEGNLSVFRRIFEVQNQEGHYLMMMGLDLKATLESADGAASHATDSGDLPESVQASGDKTTQALSDVAA